MIAFKRNKIGSIGRIVTGKTPPTDNPHNYGMDYMFIGPTDLNKHFIIQKSEKMISTQGLQTIKGCILNGLSILVGCIGWDMGNVALVEGTCATNQQINSITDVKPDFNPYYVYYWLKSKKQFLFQQASVTRTPILNKSDFSNIEVPTPDKSYQDKVVQILRPIDIKISLNNRINAELESTAKTIYDYWFVQFDFPNSKGKPYKASGGKMVWSDELKREIPEGWEAGTLTEISELIRGVSYSAGDIRDKEDNDVVPILRATNISGNVIDLESMVYVPIEFVSEEQRLNQFDILITMSSGSKDHIGKNGFYYFDESVAFGAFCAKLVAKKNFRFYLYSYTQSDFMFTTIKNECLGTNINNLNGSLVKGFKLVIPPKELVNDFNLNVETMFHKIGINRKENQKLTELRDWLLPMLMNGQIKIKDAEHLSSKALAKDEELAMAAEPVGVYKNK